MPAQARPPAPKPAAERALELRKILLIGYAFDAPLGAPLLTEEGLPANPTQVPIRMRFAFWVPQPSPYQRRQVGTFLEYLRSVVTERAALNPAVTSLDATPARTVEEYMRRHGLGQQATDITDHPEGFTLVHGASEAELQALRDGVIEEHLLDCTFEHQPSLEVIRAATMPHWEARTVASLGYLPNGAPEDHKPKPTLLFSAT